MVYTVGGRRVWLTEFVGRAEDIIVHIPVRRRGFSIRKNKTVYSPTGEVVLLGDDACMMHPDDFRKLMETMNNER